MMRKYVSNVLNWGQIKQENVCIDCIKTSNLRLPMTLFSTFTCNIITSSQVSCQGHLVRYNYQPLSYFIFIQNVQHKFE